MDEPTTAELINELRKAQHEAAQTHVGAVARLDGIVRTIAQAVGEAAPASPPDEA